jgi:hypothetical protein
MKLLLFILLLSGLSLNTSAQDGKKYKDSIKVIVSFMVDESGQPDDIKVEKMYCNCPKKLKDSITRQVKEIILKNPFPIKKDKNGNPVKARYLQPVIFKLEDEE